MQENGSYGTSIKYVSNVRKYEIKILHFAFRPTKIINKSQVTVIHG
jgi:hypothetical protein